MPPKAKSKKTQPKLKDLKAKKNPKGGARNNTIGGSRKAGD